MRWVSIAIRGAAGFFVTAALVTQGAADATAADRVYGITMPPDATKIGEDRFRATQTLSRTRRYFARTVGTRNGLIWRPIRGNPSVDGVHIVNQRTGREWDGLNIYEHRGKVYIYVVKNKDFVKPQPKKKKRRR